MTIMTGLEDNTQAVPDRDMSMDLDLQPVAQNPEHDAEELPWGNDPATATWAPMMAEVPSSFKSPFHHSLNESSDLRSKLALSLTGHLTHRQPRTHACCIQHPLSRLEEEQRAFRQSLFLPFLSNRYLPPELRSRSLVSGHTKGLGQDI